MAKIWSRWWVWIAPSIGDKIIPNLMLIHLFFVSSLNIVNLQMESYLMFEDGGYKWCSIVRKVLSCSNHCTSKWWSTQLSLRFRWGQTFPISHPDLHRYTIIYLIISLFSSNWNKIYCRMVIRWLVVVSEDRWGEIFNNYPFVSMMLHLT